MSVRDVLIIGAGPSGLSAAIAAKQRGLDYQVLEQGVLVNSIFRFPPQMVFFTTPELLEIGGLPFVSPYDKPTRAEALKYYRKVVDTYDLQITFDETVLSVEREDEGGERVFAIETRSGRGVRRVRLAHSVIMAIGYYDHPVMIGVPGEDLPHVRHYYSEPHPHYRQRVVIVGGGNSAAESALEMFRAGAHVTVVHRAAALKSTIKYWVRPDIENRIKEGSIVGKLGMIVKEIRPTSIVLQRCTDGTVRMVRTVRLTREARRKSCRPMPCICSQAIVRTRICWCERASRSTIARRRSSIRRRSKPTCRACSSPAARSRASTPARSSSRTAASTERRSSR